MKVAALDFETANAQRNSACALGVTLIDNQQITESKYWLIKPVGHFDYMNTLIHGITYNDVRNEPTFEELWPEINQYLNGRLLIAHNAAFDMSVLRKSLEGCELEKPKFEYTCTMRMAKNLWPNHYNHKLNTLCDYFNIELDHHNAASDAQACALIALELCRDQNITSFSELLKLNKNFGKKL
jgi:DNA polymerase III subunit epsilon